MLQAAQDKTYHFREFDFSGSDPYGGYGALVSQQSFSLFLNRVASAVPVTEETAMIVPAVSNAVSLISSAVAGLPMSAYRLEKKDDKMVKRPLGQSWNKILNKRWTSFEASFQARQRLIVSILLHGWGYIYLARNKSNLIRELHVLDPLGVSWDDMYDSDTPYQFFCYESRNYGVIPNKIPPEDIVCIPFLPMATDITRSYGLLSSGREAIANSLALMLYMSGYFDSISSGSFVAESPFTSGPDHDNFKEQINDAVMNMVQSGSRVFVTPKGTDFQSITADNRKSQLIETQVESVRQIARICNLPPVMIGELSGSNWSTQEINTYLANHVIKRYSNSIEQALALKMFPDPLSNREIMMDLQELQKANIQERIKGNREAVYSGQKTPNEIRSLMGDSPIDHPLADSLFMQSATVPLEYLQDPNEVEEVDPASDLEEDEELYRLFKMLKARSVAHTNGNH